MQMPLLILLMPPLSTEMQSLIIINRNIREANSKEEIMANNNINVLLDVKYAVKKGIMPRTIKINTQNMMHILLKHLQIAQLAMTLLTGILI
jgi:formaldehyde-activating enzyme involved in methanogenesis